jgi:hypothetical protein
MIKIIIILQVGNPTENSSILARLNLKEQKKNANNILKK